MSNLSMNAGSAKSENLPASPRRSVDFHSVEIGHSATDARIVLLLAPHSFITETPAESFAALISPPRTALFHDSPSSLFGYLRRASRKLDPGIASLLGVHAAFRASDQTRGYACGQMNRVGMGINKEAMCNHRTAC